MATAFGPFDGLMDGFAAAALDPTRWDDAMEVAANAAGSLGAILLPVRGRAANLAESRALGEVLEDYLTAGWVHRDERYRSRSGCC